MKGEITEATVDLGRLILQFARTNRATCLEDGVTPESDTDHTVMLGILACAFAAAEAPHLDRGMIAQFALVHDLVEAYAGDTDTFGAHTKADLHQEKEAREKAALERIRDEFQEIYPWVPETIAVYESLVTPEARFIKVLDKVLPKITHLLNGMTQLPSKEAFDEHCAHQLKKMEETYGKDQPEAIELYNKLVVRVSSAFESKN